MSHAVPEISQARPDVSGYILDDAPGGSDVSTANVRKYVFRSRVLLAQTPATGRIRLVIVEGDGAINNVRQRVAREPIVLEDETGRPIAEAAVTFLLSNQGPGTVFSDGSRSLTVMSDANGRAAARGLRPNNVNGSYEIRVNASHQGDTASTTIKQTNAFAAAAPAGISVAGAAAAGGVIAATRGGGSGIRPGAGPGGVVTTLTPGTPSVGGPQ